MDEDAAFREALLLAVANVIKFGDTDIFPFGFENHIIFDRSDDIVKLIESEFSDFSKAINSIPPQHMGMFTLTKRISTPYGRSTGQREG